HTRWPRDWSSDVCSSDLVPAPGTGVNNVRQHLNTETAFLDAEAVYGPSDTRLDWLRSGGLDGNPDNNAATLLMPNNYLPRANTRSEERRVGIECRSRGTT